LETEDGDQIKLKNEGQLSMKFSEKAPGSKGDQVPSLSKPLVRRVNETSKAQEPHIKY
jgi:hypothetical protein